MDRGCTGCAREEMLPGWLRMGVSWWAYNTGVYVFIYVEQSSRSFCHKLDTNDAASSARTSCSCVQQLASHVRYQCTGEVTVQCLGRFYDDCLHMQPRKYTRRGRSEAKLVLARTSSVISLVDLPLAIISKMNVIKSDSSCAR